MDNEDRNLILVVLCCVSFVFIVSSLLVMARYLDKKEETAAASISASASTSTSVEIEKTSQRNWEVETTAEPTEDAYPAEPTDPTEPTMTEPVWEDPDYIPAKPPATPEELILPEPFPVF